jgi:hypothetical protein
METIVRKRLRENACHRIAISKESERTLNVGAMYTGCMVSGVNDGQESGTLGGGAGWGG